MPERPGGERLDEDSLRDDALDYHASKPAGKITVVPTKPHGTQRELSLAYSPGVAYPCKEIESDPDDAYKYTSKGNLVAVVSNGTAVLRLGDIGALAGKPVMEGKGLLFNCLLYTSPSPRDKRQSRAPTTTSGSESSRRTWSSLIQRASSPSPAGMRAS